MLTLKSIEKKYGHLTAVSDIDLQVESGEFFSILGPSGSGKSTLLRLISGAEHPSRGEIFENGVNVTALPAHERHYNMVFQRYALFPHLNVYENVAFGPRMKKVKNSELTERVIAALESVQMREFQDRSVSTLSGGQQQRVALARALINRPKILLLDEPLSALDLKLRQQMQVELLGLQRKLKQTFLLVTHDQEEALTLSDRIAVMNQGRIDQVGTPFEIYEYPKTLFVAEFIGSINLLQGILQKITPDLAQISSVGKKIFMVKPSKDGMRPLPELPEGLPVLVLVRPEKLKLLKSQPKADQNSIEGTLREILYRGSLTQFYVQTKEAFSQNYTLIVSQPNTALTAKKLFSVGEKVFVAWEPEDCILMSQQRKLL